MIWAEVPGVALGILETLKKSDKKIVFEEKCLLF